MPKGKENEYFGGGMVTNDARNRNVNTAGDGFNPNPQPKPMMPQGPSIGTQGNPRPDKPLGPPDETNFGPPIGQGVEGIDFDQTNSPHPNLGGCHPAPGTYWEFEEGVKVDEEGLTDEDREFMKDAIANKEDILTPKGLRIAKKIAKAEAKLKKEKQKSKPKYGKDAKSQQEKKIKRFTAGDGKAIEKSEGSQYETKGTSVIEKEGKIYKRKPKMAKGGKVEEAAKKLARKALDRPDRIKKVKKANIKAGKEKYIIPKEYNITHIVKEVKNQLKKDEDKKKKSKKYKEGGKVPNMKDSVRYPERINYNKKNLSEQAKKNPYKKIATAAERVSIMKSYKKSLDGLMKDLLPKKIKALPKGKGLKKGKGLTNTKGKAKKIRKPEAGENKFTGKKYHQATKFFNDGLTKAEAKEKASKNVFRRKK